MVLFTTELKRVRVKQFVYTTFEVLAVLVTYYSEVVWKLVLYHWSQNDKALTQCKNVWAKSLFIPSVKSIGTTIFGLISDLELL